MSFLCVSVSSIEKKLKLNFWKLAVWIRIKDVKNKGYWLSLCCFLGRQNSHTVWTISCVMTNLCHIYWKVSSSNKTNLLFVKTNTYDSLTLLTLLVCILAPPSLLSFGEQNEIWDIRHTKMLSMLMYVIHSCMLAFQPILNTYYMIMYMGKWLQSFLTAYWNRIGLLAKFVMTNKGPCLCIPIVFVSY